jgi:hypothetical protein
MTRGINSLPRDGPSRKTEPITMPTTRNPAKVAVIAAKRPRRPPDGAGVVIGA